MLLNFLTIPPHPTGRNGQQTSVAGHAFLQVGIFLRGADHGVRLGPAHHQLKTQFVRQCLFWL